MIPQNGHSTGNWCFECPCASASFPREYLRPTIGTQPLLRNRRYCSGCAAVQRFPGKTRATFVMPTGEAPVPLQIIVSVPVPVFSLSCQLVFRVQGQLSELQPSECPPTKHQRVDAAHSAGIHGRPLSGTTSAPPVQLPAVAKWSPRSGRVRRRPPARVAKRQACTEIILGAARRAATPPQTCGLMTCAFQPMSDSRGRTGEPPRGSIVVRCHGWQR